MFPQRFANQFQTRSLRTRIKGSMNLGSNLLRNLVPRKPALKLSVRVSAPPFSSRMLPAFVPALALALSAETLHAPIRRQSRSLVVLRDIASRSNLLVFNLPIPRAGPNRSGIHSLRASASKSAASQDACEEHKRSLVKYDNAQVLKQLRANMQKMLVDAIVVPSADPHNSEYSPPHYSRREFVSGFSGSAGTAVILADKALLWTDGRYFLQAEQELSKEWTLMKAGLPNTPTINEFLANSLAENGKVWIDPFIHTISNVKGMEKYLVDKNIKMVTLEPSAVNPIDEIWGTMGRPKMPYGMARDHPLQYAGVSRTEKLKNLANELKTAKMDSMVVSMLDEVCWLLNIRGLDYPASQFIVSYCIVHANKKDGKYLANLYVDRTKLPESLLGQLELDGILVCPYDQISKDVAVADLKIWMDSNTVSFGLYKAATNAGAKVKTDISPIILWKAIKNQKELEGMKEAHYKDGAAMANFLCWVENEIVNNNKEFSEYEIGTLAETFRSKQAGHIYHSFPTIAGAGPNGAIIHYRAAEAGCRMVGRKEMLLLDSGAQYHEGTTDVTRTMHFGNPTAWECETFTRTLKGHIAIDSAVFPSGTPGILLDSFARMHLWERGLDFRHGVSHGVGSGLNVHEGPQSISPRQGNTQALIPGMVLSNEPGYYEDGAFGIRIENLIVVEPRITKNTFGNVDYLGFCRLTMIPMQKKLMAIDMLTDKEIQWINDYHQEVWKNIAPRVSGPTREWLKTATSPITRANDSVLSSRREFLNQVTATSALFVLNGLLMAPQKTSAEEPAISSVSNITTSERKWKIDPLTDEPSITARCYLDVKVGDSEPRRVIIGLYGTAVPKVARNFQELCQGSPSFKYAGSEVYRVLAGMNVQGGAVPGSKGRVGQSTYGEPFTPENFDIRHSRRGLVSMVRNPDGTVDSRFFVQTQDDAGYLDGRYVAFGRVLQGMDVLNEIERNGSAGPQNKPKKPVSIMDSGILQ